MEPVGECQRRRGARDELGGRQDGVVLELARGDDLAGRRDGHAEEHGVADLGVEIRRDAEVAQIVTSRGRARGVMLRDGTQLDAHIVASSVDAHVTLCAELLERAIFYNLTLRDL